jgi:hypothetical protein
MASNRAALAYRRRRRPTYRRHRTAPRDHVQGVEVGNTIDAKNDGLAVDHEMLLTILQRELDENKKVLSPFDKQECISLKEAADFMRRALSLALKVDI